MRLPDRPGTTPPSPSFGTHPLSCVLRPEPRKEFLNLRSTITELKFNPTSEMLAFSSKYTKNAMRTAHVAGQHVFSNWPTAKTPLNYVQCCAFSPNSGFMATGNDQGKVLLYRLNHYDSA